MPEEVGSHGRRAAEARLVLGGLLAALLGGLLRLLRAALLGAALLGDLLGGGLRALGHFEFGLVGFGKF